ncbi:MAG: hypothetical protein COV35_01180 [Alphaproteobacteria bacterium CG11_big_fil_rev_8_21_14_0_20_39_49]|nr:MAG: hypothetical protein COV35_01180 [Alphaproteobacteria bacterium CG11_big_fil_rev_8_21_14_0_20_39_49]
MPNFTKDNANNIARLLKKMTSEFDSDRFNQDLIIKSEQLKTVTDDELDINKGGVAALDIMHNIGLITPFALAYSQENPKYIKAIANLLSDASRIKGVDIDRDISESCNALGSPGEGTELYITGAMIRFQNAKPPEKEIFGQLIEGLLKNSGRNKNHTPLSFALQNGDMEFMKQYNAFIESKENKPEYTASSIKSNEAVFDMESQSKNPNPSLPPASQQNKADNELNNSLFALGGLALAGTLYYVSKKLRNSYKEQQAQKSGQELIEAEEQSKNTASNVRTTKTAKKKNTGKKSVKSGTQNIETTSASVEVPRVISFRELNSEETAPLQNNPNIKDLTKIGKSKTTLEAQSPAFTALTTPTALDTMEPFSLDAPQQQALSIKDSEISELKKEIQTLKESSALKDGIIANQKKSIQTSGKESEIMQERLKQETERADAATGRAKFSANNEKSLNENQKAIEQQNQRLSETNKFLIKKAQEKDKKIARLIREQNRPLTTNEEKARAFDEGRFRGSIETWEPALAWGYAQRAQEDQGYIGYLEGTVQDLLIKVQHAYYDGMQQGLEQSRESTQAQLVQAEERGFHRGASLDYEKFYKSLKEQVKAEKEIRQQNNNDNAQLTASRQLERKVPISPEYIEQQNALKRSRSFS